MRHLVKWLMATVFLMIATNCQKDEFDSMALPSVTGQEEQVLPRSLDDDAFSNLLNAFRAEIQALIDNGTLEGVNGYGILGRLDNIEKKYLDGKKQVALNMLNALINHLEGLHNGGVIPQELYEGLLAGVQGLIDWAEYGCTEFHVPFAYNGLSVNLPPSGNVTLTPELFLVNDVGCCVLSFSEDPADWALELSCADEEYKVVEIWVTNSLGTQDFAQTDLYLQDNFGVCEGGTSNECAPIAIAYSGLAVELNMQGEAALAASQINAGSIDACGTGSLSFSAKKSNDDNDPAEFIIFGFDDVGIVSVELWVSDGIHASKVMVQVFVQDNIAPI
ncbi:MAG: hypothetical protein KDD06_08980 [Phaeodactylibacter sp.]|nr:hypothetical protein [Phaeodactylibacter sp.]